ncbi:guanine nucleotide-binding protein subunit alpha [Dionaea muscipula]
MMIYVFIQVIGGKLFVIGNQLEYPRLIEELAADIVTLWKDSVIQETYIRGNELQLPDCDHYFMEHLQRLASPNYISRKVAAI